jgi:Mrp family chromosome partitioning ATPase
MIDSPPILPVTDGLVLSGMVDAVLVVASAGSSTKRGVKRASELLRQVDAPLIGAILNGVGSKLEYGYTYGSDDRYYVDPEQERKGSDGRKSKASRTNGNGDGSSNGKGRSRQSTRTAR